MSDSAAMTAGTIAALQAQMKALQAQLDEAASGDDPWSLLSDSEKMAWARSHTADELTNMLVSSKEKQRRRKSLGL